MLSHDGDDAERRGAASSKARCARCRASRTSPPTPRSTGRSCASCRSSTRPRASASRPSQIAETIRVATIGDIDANLAKFNAGDRLVPIRVQIEEDARTDMQRLQNLRVTNATGARHPARRRRRRHVRARPELDRPLRPRAPRRDRRRSGIALRAEQRARERSSRSSTSRSCRPACACSRPATPRSRTRWRPASSPPWAPA